MLGMGRTAVSREAAMMVPSIVKARALICGTLSRYPLAVWKGDERAQTPSWMVTTDSGISPQQRMLWTLDDLIFNGSSLWALDRDGDKIVDALRVPPGLWSLDESGAVLVEDHLAHPSEICLIEGPQEGLTSIAAQTITGAANIERAWLQRVEAPVPLVELHLTDANSPLTAQEIKELVEDWEASRREGGTAYTPTDIEVRTHGEAEADLFINGRNAVRLDVANFLNVPASILEGSTSTASLTYSTTEGKRSELVDYSLSYWATPIEARLSQDDILDPGLQCTFDLDWLATPVPTGRGPKWED